MDSFWTGFEKRAAASGATYHRDLATDNTIHSMQEDTYPEGTFSFFDPDKLSKVKKKDLGSIEGLFNDQGEDASERSNAGSPPRYLGVDALTLGHAEGGL